MRILILGGGSIGQRHIKNLKLLGHQDIYCLKREPDAGFASEYDVTVITDYNELNEIRPQVVFVCTPTALHLEGLKYASSIGAHIFMEKPLIDTHHGLGIAKELLSNYNQVFFVGFMLRYHPMVDKIKDVLARGLLGKIFSARFEFGSYLPFWHPYEDYKISYAARAELGGGVINTISHELDLIQYLFGEPDSICCQAKEFKLLGIEVEEQCEAILEYPDKHITLHLDYLQKDYDRNIKLLGTDGKLLWNWHDKFYTLKLFGQEPVRVEQDDSFDVNNLYLDELKDFFDLIVENQITHSLDAINAIRNTELMLTMHDSNKRGKTVQIK